MPVAIRRLSVLAVYCLSSVASADDGAASASRVRQAVQDAIPLIESAAAGSAEQRECFTCHHQAVPILALQAAAEAGFVVDRDNLERQIQHTITHLQRGHEDYVRAKGQGGQALTAGYALWALQKADWSADETTAAVAHYLVERQRHQPQWRQSSNRPPSSGSDFAVTFVSLQALRTWGTEPDRAAITARESAVRDWLLRSAPDDTEDHVFRLLALDLIAADAEQVAQAADALLARQRADGGWAQLPELKSDAYATATALFALQTAELPVAPPAELRRGVEFLLETQQEDGSWHVVTRAEGFQTYYESGFPWDEDQFISMAASSWAVLALVQSLAVDADADPAQSETASAATRNPRPAPGGGFVERDPHLSSGGQP